MYIESFQAQASNLREGPQKGTAQIYIIMESFLNEVSGTAVTAFYEKHFSYVNVCFKIEQDRTVHASSPIKTPHNSPSQNLAL